MRWQQLRLPALARYKTDPVNRQPCTMEGLMGPDPSPLNYEFWEVVVEGALFLRNAPLVSIRLHGIVPYL